MVSAEYAMPESTHINNAVWLNEIITRHHIAISPYRLGVNGVTLNTSKGLTAEFPVSTPFDVPPGVVGLKCSAVEKLYGPGKGL